MIFHAHLTLQVREHRLDHEANASLPDLTGWSLSELVLLGGDQLDAEQLHRAVVLGSPEAAVGEKQAAAVAGGQTQGALSLFSGLRPSDVIADGNALAVADHDQANTPHEPALGRAVSVCGLGSKVAPSSTAGIVRAADQGPVHESHLSLGDQLGDHQLGLGDVRRQTTQAPVVLSLIGQVWEPAGQQASDHPRNYRSLGRPVTAWATARAISSWSVMRPGGPGRGIESDVANTYAATTRVSSSAVISCSNHELAGLEALFSCQRHSPAVRVNPHQASSTEANSVTMLTAKFLAGPARAARGPRRARSESAATSGQDGAPAPKCALYVYGICEPPGPATTGHPCPPGSTPNADGGVVCVPEAVVKRAEETEH